MALLNVYRFTSNYSSSFIEKIQYANAELLVLMLFKVRLLNTIRIYACNKKFASFVRKRAIEG